jgi:predicted Ser/Thr protein kinase
MNTKDTIHNSLIKLNNSLRKKNKHKVYSFEAYLKEISRNPEKALRNSFQLLSDMIHYYVPTPDLDNLEDESTHYIKYDCSKLFVKNTEKPFFADRLFADRLINVTNALKAAVIRNKMLLFLGPKGSGKSTFLNTLLEKLEQFTQLSEGVMYETVWEIDIEKIETTSGYKLISEFPLSFDMSSTTTTTTPPHKLDKRICVPCPSHDHPIIQIPQEYRKKLLNEIILDNEFKKKLFYSSEYEWVLEKKPCAICASIYNALFEKLSAANILDMLHVRKYIYDRKTGDGITVYNPGDNLENRPLENPELQKWLDTIFRSSNAVDYIYSTYAKTNNGVFGIMDGKSNNKTRIKNIHTIISDGIHKVKTFEESIDSLFMTLINPEDIEIISKESSFMDRVIKIPIPYIRDYTTEIQIYKNVYGPVITSHFFPWVLETLAKVIISTRLNKSSQALNEWITDKNKYIHICDENLLLLKMEVFSGNPTPSWLKSEDAKNFTKNTKQELIKEGYEEGQAGISGRESLDIFNSFYSKYKKKNAQITIQNIIAFFEDKNKKYNIDKDIFTALINLYNYTVLQEVKESMFYYNENEIRREIQNYLFAINNEIGSKIVCPYTKDHIEITENYFKTIESRLFEDCSSEEKVLKDRNRILNQFVSKTIQEVKSGIKIIETEQFKSLELKYDQNLKTNVLAPYINNTNFRRAIKDIKTNSFNNYDLRIRNEINYLIKNLKFKFNYTDTAAQQIVLYVIDEDLVTKFPDTKR